jgi:hypothetical protein
LASEAQIRIVKVIAIGLDKGEEDIAGSDGDETEDEGVKADHLVKLLCFQWTAFRKIV